MSRIRLSDKTSRVRPRHVVPKPGQPYESEIPVEVRERIAPAPAALDLMLAERSFSERQFADRVDLQYIASQELRQSVTFRILPAAHQPTSTATLPLLAWL